MAESPPTRFKDIALGFVKLGATAYGGPAIIGVMQAEFQDKRQWLSKPRFLEGLALVNVLPGATGMQLAIFIGHHHGGAWGGLLAGLSFATPGFLVMLALAMTYATLGISPVLRGALYGLGPVVLAIFIVAVVRLGTSAMRAWPHRLIAVAAGVLAVSSPLGTVAILMLAAGVGLLLFHSRRAGAVLLLAVLAGLALASLLTWSPLGSSASGAHAPSLGGLFTLFVTIGALTFGGGLSMIALLEEHVVGHLGWLTPQEFIAGLALGQLTPGPVLMIAAYVGYTLLGAGGAIAAIVAVFLPSFVLMLAILPAFDRVRTLPWTKAVIQGIAPAVIGVMAVALARMAPHAAPNAFAVVVLLAAVGVLLLWRLAPLKAMLAGAVAGMLRARLCEWPVLRAVLCVGSWGR